MRWHIFAIFAFVFYVLEIGLRPLLHINAGMGWVCPSFVLILGSFIAIWAPPRTTLWAMLVLGFLLDLQPLDIGDGITVTAIIGPSALGYLLAGYAVVQFRAPFYRESAFTVAVMVLIGGIFANLVTVALLTFRGLPFLADPIAEWSAREQLFHRFLQLIYTAVCAIPVGYLLIRTQSLWGFDSAKNMGVRRLG